METLIPRKEALCTPSEKSPKKKHPARSDTTVSKRRPRDVTSRDRTKRKKLTTNPDPENDYYRTAVNSSDCYTQHTAIYRRVTLITRVISYHTGEVITRVITEHTPLGRISNLFLSATGRAETPNDASNGNVPTTSPQSHHYRCVCLP